MNKKVTAPTSTPEPKAASTQNNAAEAAAPKPETVTDSANGNDSVTEAPAPKPEKKVAVPKPEKKVAVPKPEKKVAAPAPKPEKKSAPKIKPAEAEQDPEGLPRKLAGGTSMYLLMAAPRPVTTDSRSAQRRLESGRMQEQCILGASLSRANLKSVQKEYAKQYRHLYIWVAEVKAEGVLPKNVRRAIAIENIIDSYIE